MIWLVVRNRVTPVKPRYAGDCFEASCKQSILLK